MSRFFDQRYSKQGLWSLFLMCAFPLHAWTLVLVFRDLSWMSERTNFWDAVGVAAYALLFAFIESLVCFVILALLGFLVSTAWDQSRRLALLAMLFLVLSLWAMLGQLYFLTGFQVPSWLLDFMVRDGHPVRIMYAILLAAVTPSLALPAWFALRSQGFAKAVNALVERLSLLTSFYLVFDVAGLVLVLVRNLS